MAQRHLPLADGAPLDGRDRARATAATTGRCSTPPRSTGRSRDAGDATVHTVSVCPLGPAGAGRDLECRTTAFVGPNTSQWYVTETDAFLWMTSRTYQSFDPQSCDLRRHPETDSSRPCSIASRSTARRPAWSAPAASRPTNSRSMRASGRFRALLQGPAAQLPGRARRRGAAGLSRHPAGGLRRHGPRGGGRALHARCRASNRIISPTASPTATWSMAASASYRRGLSEESMPPAYAVPVDRPADVRRIALGHTMIRAEQAGSDIVRDRLSRQAGAGRHPDRPRRAAERRLVGAARAALRERGPQPRLQQPDRGRRQRRDGPADDRPREREQPRRLAQRRLGPELPRGRPARPAARRWASSQHAAAMPR